MSDRLPILAFDKDAGLAYAKLVYFLRDALPRNSYEIVRITDPAQAVAVARQSKALAFLPAMGTAAQRKFKDMHLGGSKKAAEIQHATWKALGAFAPLYPKYKFDDASPGTLGTYWRGAHGAYICGVSNPISCDHVWKTLTARWLRGGLGLVRGEAHVRQFSVHLEAPLSVLESSGLCTFDLETAGFTDTITYFGYADASGGYSWAWTPEVKEAVTRWAACSRPKVGQNSIGYDVPCLARNGINVRGPLGDTMALRSVWCRQFSYNLQSIAAQCFMVEPWKASWKEGLSSEAEYNAKDAQATYWIADHLHAKLDIPRISGLERVL